MGKSSLAFKLVVILLIAVFSQNAHAQQYTLTLIPLPNLSSLPPPANVSGAYVVGYGINNGGEVVGNVGGLIGIAQQAFVYNQGSSQLLPTLYLPGLFNAAAAINLDGIIVGESQNSFAQGNAVSWRNGSITDLGSLYYIPGIGSPAPAANSSAAAINSNGAAAGSSVVAAGPTHAALYSGGAVTDLGTLGGASSEALGINDSGIIVGDAQTLPVTGQYTQSHAFYYDGTLHDLGVLPNGTGSSATAINASGTIVGWSDTTNGGSAHAVVWATAGTGTYAIQDLGTLATLAGNYSRANAINSSGQIVGQSATPQNGQTAFIYSNGVMTDLNSLLPAGSSVTLYDATAINDSGQIVAYSLNFATNVSTTYLLTPIQITPPVITPTVSGVLGLNGWYTGNTTVNWSVTDAQSAITSQIGCGPTTVSNDTTGQSITCTATSAGGTATQTVTIKRDATPPLVNGTISPIPNANGWNSSAVTVSFGGTDSTSGIAGCSSNVVINSQGASQSASGSCTDQAGNVGYATVRNINIDESTPVVTDVITDSVPESATGWYTAPVTISFAGTDPLSGVLPGSCTAPVTLSDGANQTVTGTCTNLAGITAPIVITGINVDTTPPLASFTAAPPPNANGWNNTPVTVTFEGTDNLNGSGVAGCSAPIVLSLEGAGQSVVGTCTDVAGNNSGPVADNVNIDLTPPIVVVVTPQTGSGFPVGYPVSANYSCTDGSSGVLPANCIGTVVNGGPLDTSTAGTQQFLVNATDRAGNTIASTSSYLVSTLTFTSPGSIWTYAGNGQQQLTGDGGPAVSAGIGGPYRAAVDAAGNVYTADSAANAVRRVDSATGDITSVPALTNRLSTPLGVAVDASGNLYVANSAGFDILRVDATTGVVTRVAGNGSNGTNAAGDGGPATNATLGRPTDVAVDSSGNIYIAAEADERIRRVEAATGIISTIAGNGTVGYTGDGGPATAAELYEPFGIALDGAGNLYIADAGNYAVRRVDAVTGVITTVAGTGIRGTYGQGDGGPAAAAQLGHPYGVAIDRAGNLFIADWDSSSIRRVDAISGIITTAVGAGQFTFSGDGGAAKDANIAGPTGLAIDAKGNLYIADTSNNRIRLAVAIGSLPDTTPPVITPTVSGTQGTNGWYTSNVTVTWAVNDPLAPVISQTGCGAITVSADTSGQTITCAATGQGGTSSQSVTIKRDATAPIAIATAAPVPNGNGWNNAAVTVSFTGADSTSGVASCSPAVTVSSEGLNQSSTAGTCTDNAGNISTAVKATGINIDETPPTVSDTVSVSIPESPTGWYTAPVTISFAGTDPLSGVLPGGCAAPVTLSDGANQTVTASCTNLAGISAPIVLTGINVDTTPPVASFTAAPPPNANGWNNAPVTVTFSGTDSINGSGIAGCSPSVTLSNEGAAQPASGNCTDIAGNSSAPASDIVSVDLTPPTISIVTPQTGSGFPVGYSIPANYTCVDALSGVLPANCTGAVANGVALDTSTAGTQQFLVTGTDQAGNTVTSSSSYLVSTLTFTSPGSIWTYAGNGVAGYSGDSGPAPSASVNFIYALTIDAANSVYLTDGARIRKVDSKTGLITTFAGNGSFGYGGDGGAAIDARLFLPTGVAFDPTGNLYIADYGNQRIRRVDGVTGIITTVAGNGTPGFGGDGGLATTATLSSPYAVAVDLAGNLYVDDRGNNRIRRIDALTGVIETIAGNGTAGYNGDGILAINASLANPSAVVIDRNGNLYISDTNNERIRRVDSVSGIISTVAGNGTAGGSPNGDGGPAIAAELGSPASIALDAVGNLYIADAADYLIRRVDSSTGIISSVAGNGGYGFSGDGGMATGANLAYPYGLALDASGDMYIADSSNFRIRRVAPAPLVLTAPAAATVIQPGQSVNVQWTGGATDWLMTLEIVDVAANTVATGVSNVPNTGSYNWTFPAALPFNGPCGRTYRYYIENSARTSWANGQNFTVVCADNTPPTITPQMSGTQGLNGWYTGNVTLTWSVVDPESPVTSQTGCDAVSIISDTTGTAFTCTATSAGGTSTQSVTIKRDATPPVATATASPAANTNGWNNSTVTVVFNGTDSLSGSGLSSCTPSITLSSPGAGQIASGSCKDVAGNSSATVSARVNIDETPPTIAVTTPANGTTYVSGSIVNAAFGCTDTFSGLATCVGSAANGAAIDTSGTGTKSFTVTATDKAGNSTQTVATYTVSVAAPAFTLAPSSVPFGSQALNVSTVAVPVTLTSTGTSTVSISSIRVTGTNANQFSQTNNCGSSVAAGAACTVNVVFRPTSAGAKTATITVLTGNAGTKTVNLTGTGVASSYSVSPTTIAFGSEQTNIPTAVQTATVTNSASVALPLTSISLGGTNANQFSQTNTCGTSVPAVSSCAITVIFTPTSAGAKSATLSVRPSGAATQSVALSGTGIVPTYTVTPSPLAFGSQAVGVASAGQTLTLTNTGTLALPITSIALSGGNTNQFSLSKTCGASLAPSSTCSITVVFTPTSAGAKSTTVRVTASGGAATVSVPVTGTGVVPTYSLSTTSLAYGNQARNTASPAQTITLTNTGTLDLPITSVSLTGGNANQFSQTNSCGTSVAAGSTCTINVVFKPTSTGNKTATLRVTPGGGAATQSVSLTGTGI